MPTFPILKTGAVTQYPSVAKVRFGPTTIIDFLDGSSHRYCTGPQPLRQWIVRLEGLDAREDALVTGFLREYHDSTFSFTDPVSGDLVANCGLQGREFGHGLSEESNSVVSAVIEELR